MLIVTMMISPVKEVLRATTFTPRSMPRFVRGESEAGGGSSNGKYSGRWIRAAEALVFKRFAGVNLKSLREMALCLSSASHSVSTGYFFSLFVYCRCRLMFMTRDSSDWHPWELHVVLHLRQCSGKPGLIGPSSVEVDYFCFRRQRTNNSTTEVILRYNNAA